MQRLLAAEWQLRDFMAAQIGSYCTPGAGKPEQRDALFMLRGNMMLWSRTTLELKRQNLTRPSQIKGFFLRALIN